MHAWWKHTKLFLDVLWPVLCISIVHIIATIALGDGPLRIRWVGQAAFVILDATYIGSMETIFETMSCIDIGEGDHRLVRLGTVRCSGADWLAISSASILCAVFLSLGAYALKAFLFRRLAAERKKIDVAAVVLRHW